MPRITPLALVTALLVGVPVYWALPEGLGPWRSIAIVFGWVGCGLLLANLLFVIREPWLAKQLGGLERMYVWHHKLGLAAYIVILSHPLALAFDAWTEQPSLAWAVLAPWQQSWPGWLGWLSLLCLMAGMGSAMASRTPYSIWRWLHWLLAVAVILAVAHLFVLGLDFPLLWSPFLAIGFILWRVVRADFGVAAKPFIVSEVKSPAKDIVEVLLKPLSHAIDARPGQFVLAVRTTALIFVAAVSSTHLPSVPWVRMGSFRLASRRWAIAHSTSSYWSRGFPPESMGLLETSSLSNRLVRVYGLPAASVLHRFSRACVLASLTIQYA